MTTPYLSSRPTAALKTFTCFLEKQLLFVLVSATLMEQIST